MPMTPYGPSNSVGGFNSGDVDWSAFYNNMGAGENIPWSQQSAQTTPYANSAWGASRAYPTYVPGTANGTTLVGKNQTQFATDNPLQAQQLAYVGQQPNPAAAAAAAAARNPVSLTVTGGGTPYNNRGWGAGLISALLGGGADPGMGGLNGNMQMNPGIRPQLPPADGSSPLPRWRGDQPQSPPMSAPVMGRPIGTQHNGSSAGPAAYTSGGYLFDRNGAQIGRDPNGVMSQTYKGTPQAMAAAQARDRMTAGTEPQQNAQQSMGMSQWLAMQAEDAARERARAASRLPQHKARGLD